MCKMVVREYSIDNYISPKIGIGAEMKNLSMLKFVPEYLKTKKKCNYAIRKLPLVIRYVSDKYKTKKCVIKLF